MLLFLFPLVIREVRHKKEFSVYRFAPLNELSEIIKSSFKASWLVG
jgi:hypothetical protein